jgi:phosphoenolpyruvate synthase/pyruvate phosphate dikinase
MTLLVDLSDIDSTMINAVGGKALNLGIMSSEELPVPGGFSVTTDAYRLVVADQLDDLMGKLADAPDAGVVAAAAEEARRRVLAISLRTSCELRSPIVTARWATTSRSPYAHRPPLRTWRTRASPANKTPTST